MPYGLGARVRIRRRVTICVILGATFSGNETSQTAGVFRSQSPHSRSKVSSAGGPQTRTRSMRLSDVFPGAAEHRHQHLFGQLPGGGVLLAWMRTS